MPDVEPAEGWQARALVHGQAPAGAACCRCDLPLLPDDPAASVAGLKARGWAHTGCLPEDAPVTHFAVPGARELLLDVPQPCPAYPAVTFDGLAVALDGEQHFLVVTVRPPSKLALRLHLGPDPEMIARRGLVVVAALRTHGGQLADPALSVGILAWLAACWAEASGAVEDAVTQVALT